MVTPVRVLQSPFNHLIHKQIKNTIYQSVIDQSKIPAGAREQLFSRGVLNLAGVGAGIFGHDLEPSPPC